MKKIILLLFNLILFTKIEGQIIVHFDTLIVNSVIEVKENDILVSDFSFGPDLTIKFSIENISDSIIVIKNPFNQSILTNRKYIPALAIEYSINNQSMIKEITYWFVEDVLSIPSQSRQDYPVGLALCLPFIDYSNDYLTIFDHSKYFYEILPSLKLNIYIPDGNTYSLTPTTIIKGEYFINLVDPNVPDD